MQQTPDTVMLRGGLDLVTPALAVAPRMAIAAANYEAETRGYRRIEGYEAFDGRTRPSETNYWTLDFITGTVAIVAGDTVTGLTSGATAVALTDAVLEAGSYAGGDAAGQLILWQVTGTFVDAEALQVSAVTQAIGSGTQLLNGALDDTTNETYRRAAIEARRALVTAVPGSGPVRGVWTYSGDIYAVRDNAGATEGILYKSSAAGWVAQALGHTLDFNSGSSEFVEGETLTGGTSGATATIERIVRTGGSWPPDAVGYLVLSGITGVFVNGEAITSATGAADAVGTQEANTFSPGGRYEFINHNFYANSTLERMYGVNGVDRAFEYDGTIFEPIRTGLSAALDKPTHINEISEHMFLSYVGGSILHSGPGQPTEFEVLDGAGEIGFGTEITGLLSSDTALIVFGRKRIGYITGNDATNFVLKTYSDKSGAKEWTASLAGRPIYMDDYGVRDLSTTQAFGDWRMGTLTQLIEPLFASKRKLGVTPVASMTVRGRDLYRLFFSDKSVVSIYLGRKVPECMPLDLPFQAFTTCSGEDANDIETLLVGAEDGFVYEMDRGTSFNGAEVTAYIRLPWAHQGAIRMEKRYHRGQLELDGANSTQIAIAIEYEYGNPDIPASPETLSTILGGGGFWNESNWDEFYWSSQVQGVATFDMNGIGRNVSVAVLSNATHEQPHTLSALTVNYSPRRMIR